MTEMDKGTVNDRETSALVDFFKGIVVQDPSTVAAYAEMLRAKKPDLDSSAFAQRLVKRSSMRCGLFGAVTSLGGFITLPITVPADLLVSFRIQARLVMAVAHCFGHPIDKEDMVNDIMLLLLGNAAQEALKNAGIEAAKQLTKKAVDKYITGNVMKQLWKVISRKLLTKAGEKSLTSFTKLIPLVGAPVGFAFNYLGTRAVGKLAIRYYSEP